MDHELVKKLKDAGFPQTRTTDLPYPNYYTEDGKIRNPARDDIESWDSMIKIPFLEELIEELTKDSVIVITTGKAYSQVLHSNSGVMRQSRNLETTLAELWLSVNKKV